MAVSTTVSSEVGLDGTTTHVIALPSAISAGDLLWICIAGVSDETYTITAISDTINGSWSLTGTVSSPGDDGGGTARIYLAHRMNSGAGAAPTITVTTSSGQGGFGIGGSVSGPEIAAFEAYFTPSIQGASTTTHPSPSTTSTGANGIMLGLLWVNSARTTTFAAGTKINSISGRLHPMYLLFTSSGSHSDTGTSSTGARSVYHAAIFVTSGGGGFTGFGAAVFPDAIESKRKVISY